MKKSRPYLRALAIADSHYLETINTEENNINTEADLLPEGYMIDGYANYKPELAILVSGTEQFGNSTHDFVEHEYPWYTDDDEDSICGYSYPSPYEDSCKQWDPREAVPNKRPVSLSIKYLSV